MRHTATLCALALLVKTASVASIELNTLEWPPFASAKLPGQGSSIALARQALRTQGEPLKVNVMPWNRAIKSAQERTTQLGYLPVYLTPGARCNYSDSLGNSVLVMAQRRDNPLQWRSIDELGDYKIGVVAGYNNYPEFDQKVAQGTLSVETAANDRLNLLKLLHQRVDFAVIDTEVMSYWLEHDATLNQRQSELAQHADALATLTLHVCFASGAQADRVREALNRGLKALQAQRPNPPSNR